MITDKNDLDVAVLVVKERFGIDLRWSEAAALKHYIDRFSELGSSAASRSAWSSIVGHSEGIYRFMDDYFGLNIQDLGRGYSFLTKRYYGMDLAGDERFKEYCRRHVNEWRAERELI
jgi:hypothetical protein